MESKKLLSTVFCLFLCVTMLHHCSINPSSVVDGSSSETVIGTIVTATGQAAPHTRVLLIPKSFNPLINDAETNIRVDTTNAAGVYSFSKTGLGIYNIEAAHLTSGTKLLVREISVSGDTTTVPPATLQEPGSIEVHFPNTIDTTIGYVYIPGTTIYKKLSDLRPYGTDHFAVTLHSVPATTVSIGIFTKRGGDSSTVILPTPAVIKPQQTVVIDYTSQQMKPLWGFSLLVGVQKKSVAHYGGMDSIARLVSFYVEGVTTKFNTPKVFNGLFRFTIDSIYAFSDPIEEEVKKTHTGSDFRLLMDRFSDWSHGGWYYSTKTMCRAKGETNSGSLFDQSSIDVAAWEFGRARGCTPLSWLEVKKEKNLINNEAYRVPIQSIMNWPYGVNSWDPLNINFINYYADSLYTTPKIVNRAFPSSMGIMVTSAIGEPLANVPLTLYGVKLKSKSVDQTPALTGKTDSTGVFMYTKNPYNPESKNYLKYYNLLVQAIHEKDTLYTWQPVYNAINTWFTNPDTAYITQIHF